MLVFVCSEFKNLVLYFWWLVFNRILYLKGFFSIQLINCWHITVLNAKYIKNLNTCITVAVVIIIIFTFTQVLLIIELLLNYGIVHAKSDMVVNMMHI